MLLLVHEINGDKNEIMKQHFVVICRFPPMVLPVFCTQSFSHRATKQFRVVRTLTLDASKRSLIQKPGGAMSVPSIKFQNFYSK